MEELELTEKIIDLLATGVEIGLLLNFGGQRLEFKRKARIYRPKQPPKDFIL